MSARQQRPQSRRQRRSFTPQQEFRAQKLDLPGPLKIFANARLFAIMGGIFGIAIVLSLFAGGILGGPSTTSPDGPMQANEAPDVPVGQDGTAVAEATATPASAVKRYTAAPAMSIDPAKRYTATIRTSKGDIQVELYADQAPQAVNAFVFLARDGYYNGTPFMNLFPGTQFSAQAGDPTRTGLGSPGFSVKKEQTDRPFEKGAVGMGGSSSESNGGQFFISLSSQPSLTGKYTIFGRITSGIDVLDRLSLLPIVNGRPNGSGDEIQSVTISES